ncbi:MAG: bifunctional riboflavin kinase/FAD synthetase [Lachnospiraceae bacterium]|nr:bifunctional riboflavin kinase/FAD synthetase [Lachnospiraceae bacterium]
MDYIKGIENYRSDRPSGIMVGKFDGIHRGHGLLTKKLTQHAKKKGLCSLAVTFDVSPRLRLKTDGLTDKNIITADERAMLLEKEGVDAILELEFTDELMSMEPEAFIEMLMEKCGMKYIICGTDFTFGHFGKGDVKLLSKLAKEYGFEVEVIEKIRDEKRDISSTYVREEIINGRIEQANSLLGYNYFIYGQVIHGRHIGTGMSIPTINMVPTSDKLLPPHGVYVSRVELDGMKLTGVTNLGYKPTVEKEEKKLSLETHIIDYSGDLYGEKIMVEFLRFIRPERRFESLTELSEQVKKDILAARRISEE